MDKHIALTNQDHEVFAEPTRDLQVWELLLVGGGEIVGNTH
jgi:hypothetical protein